MIILNHNAYFDRTYSAKTKWTVVGGFISSVDEWAQFESEWRLTLAKYDVPYFHMRNFISHRAPFDHGKWTVESYRAQFISTLVAIIKDWTIASVACGVNQDTFEAVNSRYELDKRFNPYALCGRDCAVASKLIIRERYGTDRPISYYFERGDTGWGMLDTEMEKSGLPNPQKRKSRPENNDRDTTDPPVIQLQACDFAAWELRRAKEDQDIGRRVRQSLSALSQTSHHWTQYREPDLLKLCESAKIGLRG